MDPLSIVAGTVGILDVGYRVSRFLVEVKRGSDTVDKTVDGLIDEINLITSVCGNIKRIFGSKPSDENPPPYKVSHTEDQEAFGLVGRQIADALAQCSTTMGKLDVIITRIRGTSGEESSTMDRIRRTLRKMSREDELLGLWQKLNRDQQLLSISFLELNIIETRYSREAQATTSAESVAQIAMMLVDLRSDLEKRLNALSIASSQGLASGDAVEAQNVKKLASLNGHFMIPQSVSTSFKGRTADLENLQAAYKASLESATTRRFVVYGIGGAGKTQFSCKFALDHQAQFWGVFYIDASNPTTAKASLADLAERFGIKADQRSVKNWLSLQKMPWLLIMDNLDDGDDSALLHDCIPEISTGLVMITTRDPSLRTMGNLGTRSYHFGGLMETESVELLLTSADQPLPFVSAATKLAREVCSALGHLPLAVVQAGRAILKKRCTLSTCLAHFRKTLANVRIQINARHQQGGSQFQSDSNQTVFSTYEMLISGFSAADSEDAVDLLKLLSFMHYQHFRFEVLVQAISVPRQELEATKNSTPTDNMGRLSYRKHLERGAMGLALRLDQILQRLGDRNALPKIVRVCEKLDREEAELHLRHAFSQLQSVGLVNHVDTDDSYSVHPLIHWWARERMSISEQALWCHAASTVLGQATSLPPFGGTDKAREMRRYMVSHVEHVRRQDKRIEKEFLSRQELRRRSWPEHRRTLSRSDILRNAKFGLMYFENGHPAVATELMVVVDDYLCHKVGLTNPRAMWARLFLAETTKWAGNEVKAAELQKELLQTVESMRGREDEDVLIIMEKLGMSLWQQGRYLQAREYADRALRGLENVCGSGHPKTCMARSHFGQIIAKLAMFDEALHLQTQALEGLQKCREGAVKEEDLLEVKEALAMAHHDRYRYLTRRAADLDIALRMETEVLARREEILGKEHHLTLLAACNFAKVKAHAGEIEEAEAIFRQRLPIAFRRLGEDHIGTLFGKTYFGYVLVLADKLDEAQAMLEGVVTEHEKQRKGHGDQLVAIAFLVRCYRLQRNEAEADEMVKKLVQGCRDTFGEGSLWEHYFITQYNNGEQYVAA